jgi:Flp pilus assembly protein TadB
VFSKAFWSGAAIGVVLVVLFWLFVIALFIIAAVVVMLGPAAGVVAAIVLLGLCFLTLHRILRRVRPSREATKMKDNLPSP